MSSEKQIRASQSNGARSRGPITPQGKAHASRNSLRHGILARQILVGKESPSSFKALYDFLVSHFSPLNDVELGYIEEMAAAYWRLRRTWAVETEMLEAAMANQTAESTDIARMAAAFGDLACTPKLSLLHRYETRLHVMYQRAFHNLLVMRKAGMRNEPGMSLDLNAIPEIEHPGIRRLDPASTPIASPKRPILTP